MRRSAMRLTVCIFTLLTFVFPSAAQAEEPFTLYARGAVLMDGDSGRILYGKEADEELPMASTTKIMTCIVALEEAEPDTVCTVSANAAAQPQVKLGMVKGDTFYLEELLYSLMLESHNDSAVCIAETVGGSVPGFAERMNAKAREIGCTQTHYITPNGLDAEDEGGSHRTTARELALVMRYCLTQSPESDEFLKITGTMSHTVTNMEGTRSYGCTNHNALLTILSGAVSGKTGFTGKAGYCYVGAVEEGGRLFIVSLLACGWPGHKGYKWIDTKKLVAYGKENFEKRIIAAEIVPTADIPVADGQKDTVRTQAVQGPGIPMLLRRGEQAEYRVELLPSLTAPVQKGTLVGTVRWYVDGAEYASTPVLTAGSVPARSYWSCLREVLERFAVV